MAQANHPVHASPVRTMPRRRHWTRQRKIAFLLVFLIVLAPFAAGGYYLYNITSAINDVQTHSVQDLPQRRGTLGGVAQHRTPTAEPTATVAAMSTPVFGDHATPSLPSPEATAEPATAVAAQPTVGPTATQTTATTNQRTSSLGIARDLINTGTGVDPVKPSEVWGDKPSINILVLGVDRREDGGNQNADVIIIARVEFDTGVVRAVSIPRDLYVEVPDYGMSKINGAYNIGIKENPESKVAGVAMMRDTIEYNFGIPIDEYVMVDFNGFEKVIDAVGGIEINVPQRIEDDAYPTEDYGTRKLVIEAGPQHMDGQTALAYARTRHQDSDDQRRERQMQVIRALLDKGQSLGSLTSIAQVIRASGGAIMTSIDWDGQLALAGIALKMDQANVVMGNVKEPMVTPGTSDDGQWIYVGDPVVIGQYIEGVLSGAQPPD